jgi:hypothetical protein
MNNPKIMHSCEYLIMIYYHNSKSLHCRWQKDMPNDIHKRLCLKILDAIGMLEPYIIHFNLWCFKKPYDIEMDEWLATIFTPAIEQSSVGVYLVTRPQVEFIAKRLELFIKNNRSFKVTVKMIDNDSETLRRHLEENTFPIRKQIQG